MTKWDPSPVRGLKMGKTEFDLINVNYFIKILPIPPLLNYLCFSL